METQITDRTTDAKSVSDIYIRAVISISHNTMPKVLQSILSLIYFISVCLFPFAILNYKNSDRLVKRPEHFVSVVCFLVLMKTINAVPIYIISHTVQKP
jgi:hypothetical protein